MSPDANLPDLLQIELPGTGAFEEEDAWSHGDDLLDHLRVASPCDAAWDEMEGDDLVRVCLRCQLQVYNLSGMTQRDADAFVRETEGQLCIRFYRRHDGTLLTDNCPVGWGPARRRLLMWMGNAVAALGVAGILAPAIQYTREQGGVCVCRPFSLPPPANETPQYWSRIANDFNDTSFHRRCAVFQLFKRHVHVGIRLSELTHLLDRPTWLRASDIDVFDFIGGLIPVRMDSKDTVFVLRVLPEAGEDASGIYLRVAGKIDVQSFRSFVLGSAKTTVGNATVVEIGFSEP
jgi:hypothetical protein